MKINIEHIEERMFDYYEGNLSEQEKNDLLNLIHQHPEYEVEFTRWAQSYAHVDHDEPDYGLTKQLLKKPLLSDYVIRYAVTLSLIALITGTLTYFYVNKNEPLQEQPVQTIQIQKSVVEKEESNTVLSKIKPKGSFIKENDFASGTASADVVVNNNSALSTSVVDTLSVQVSTKPAAVIVAADEKQQGDTVGTKSTPVKTNTEIQEKQQVKYKRKINLKPTTDFIPTNPNF